MNVTEGSWLHRKGRRGRKSHGSDLSTSMNYDWTIIQTKVLIHSLLQQDEHLSTMSNRHTGYWAKAKGALTSVKEALLLTCHCEGPHLRVGAIGLI